MNTDCIQCCFYAKDWHKATDRKSIEKTAIMIEYFCGIEVSSMPIDKESHIMSIICRERTLTFAFHNHEMLAVWQAIIRKHLGEGLYNEFEI